MMKRYNIYIEGEGYSLEEHPKGDYVRYEDVKDFIEYAMHIHEARYKDEDICALCEHDIRHPIHIRITLPSRPGDNNDA